MNEKDNFANVQRLNSAVMAKYQWTSSRMGMQKSSEEVYDRRLKTNQKANEFLQGLLRKRSDGTLLDDRSAIDRYYKFIKNKTKGSNDDDLLDEFERRLRSLHNNHRRNQKAIDSQTSEQFQNQEKRVRRTISTKKKLFI